MLQPSFELLREPCYLYYWHFMNVSGQMWLVPQGFHLYDALVANSHELPPALEYCPSFWIVG